MSTQISGDIGVSQCQPGSVSQGDLQVGVVGKGPAAIAGSVSGQVLTSGTPMKFDSTSEVLDTNSNYDAPNSRFQPTVAGIYQCTATVGFTADTSIAVIGAYIRKNGAAPAVIQNFQSVPASPVTQSATLNVSGLVEMNGTTDYLEPWVLATGVGTLTAGTLPQSFTACLVRAA